MDTYFDIVTNTYFFYKYYDILSQYRRMSCRKGLFYSQLCRVASSFCFLFIKNCLITDFLNLQRFYTKYFLIFFFKIYIWSKSLLIDVMFFYIYFWFYKIINIISCRSYPYIIFGLIKSKHCHKKTY